MGTGPRTQGRSLAGPGSHPGCPSPPHTPPLSWFPWRLAFHRPLSPPSPNPCGTPDSWRLSPHFLSPTAWWPLVSMLPLGYIIPSMRGWSRAWREIGAHGGGWEEKVVWRNMFIYLAAVGLSCGTQDLHFGIWHTGLVPLSGIKPVSSALQGRFLTTGSPGNLLKRHFFFLPWSFSPEAKASPVNGGCVGTVHAEGSSSSLDRAISVRWERWKCSQAWGWLVIPNSRGSAVGGNHDFYFSCGSKITFCLGLEPHTLGSPAPCWLAVIRELSTASPSARHFLAWEPRAGFLTNLWLCLKASLPSLPWVLTLGVDRSSYWIGDNRPISQHTQCGSRTCWDEPWVPAAFPWPLVSPC